ncbi:E3 ubiquitin-protein ligase TRIM45-like [Oculina patagonica]
MESLLKNLKPNLTCSICLDIYNEPKTISCLHTFCSECLSNHAKASQRQGKFLCPECQALIDLPEGNRFKSLPNSFFHNSLLSLLAVRQSGDGSNITCSQCRKTNSQMYHCFDCGRFMCPDCNNAHDMLKDSFEGHKVKPVKEFEAEDYEAWRKRKPFCSQQFHEKEITRFFCFSCQGCVCQICIVTDHRNHEIVLLDKAAHNEKPNIMSGAEMIEEKISKLDEVIRQFKETISQLENNVSTAKRGVSQAAEQIIAEIREREQEVIVSLETTRVTRLERINSAIQEAQSLVKQMKQAVEFANNLAHGSSSSDLMSNKETLKERFEVLHAIAVPKHSETTFVKFFSRSASVDWLKLGYIETIAKVDANRSTLEGLDQTLQAGVKAEFTLCPKTSDGGLSNQADLNDQVEVLIEPAKDVSNVMVSEKDDGNLQLQFTPKAPGAYSIEVKINGDRLPTCPFTMQVKERELVVDELNLKIFEGDAPQEIVDANQSTLKGLDQTLQAGVEAEFTLCPKTSDGELSNQADIKNQVKVRIEPAKDVTNVMVSEKEDGNLQLKFTPKVPRTYSIKVKINGDRIPISPFTMQVKERKLVVVGKLDLKLLQGVPLQGLSGVAVNTEGKMVVTDKRGHCVYVFDNESNCLRKIGSHKYYEQFNKPSGVSFLNDNEILIADKLNHRIQHINIQTGTVVKSFGKYGAGKGEFKSPLDVCLDDKGRIVVTEYQNHRIHVLSKKGKTIYMFGDSGPEKLNYPTNCIPYKNMFLVSDRDCIKVYADQSGTFMYKFGIQGNQDGHLNSPYGMLIDRSNNLLVCDSNNHRVQQFSLDGRFTGKTLTYLPDPVGIATAPDGRILVTSFTANKVYILN